MIKRLVTLTLVTLFSGSVHAEVLSHDTPYLPMVPDSLISPGQDGYRTGGIIPFRKDSPALHFEPAEQEVETLLNGEFNSSAPGSFSFVRKRQPQPIPEGVHALARGGFGSFGTIQTTLFTSYGTERASIEGSYGYRKADVAEAGGGGLRGDVYPATSTARYRSDTADGRAYESHAGYLRVNARPFDPLTCSVSWFRIAADDIRYPMLKLDSANDTNSGIEAAFRVSRPLPGIRNISVTGFWRGYEALFDDRLRESARLPNGTLRMYSLQNWGEQNKYGTRFSASVPLVGGETTIGGEYGTMNVNAISRTNSGTTIVERSLIPDVATTLGGGYLSWQSESGKDFRFGAGLRVDAITAEAQKAPNAAKFAATEPSGWLKGSWRAGENLDAALAFGSTVKFPNAQELFIGVAAPAAQLGVPGLSPSRSYRPELSIDYRTASLELHGYAYWAKVEDYVAIYQMNPSTKSFRNIEAELWGAGISSALKFTDSTRSNVTLDYLKGDDITWSKPLPEIAPLTGSASVTYDDHRFIATVSERFSSRQWRTDTSLGEQPNPSWAVTDIKVGYRFSKIAIFAGVNNVFDTRYFTHLLHIRDPLATGVRVPEAGRFIWALAEISL